MMNPETLVWKQKEYRVSSEASKFEPGFRPVILRISGEISYLGSKVFPTQQLAEAFALEVFEGKHSGFRY